MNISKPAVKRPVSTIMLILIVILLGVVSYSKLAIDLYPNIEIPVAIVQTSYENVGPEEVEKLITQPIEEVLGTVENIDNIQSITAEGSSVVVVQFNFGTNMDFATLKMREKVDIIKGFLPDGANSPTVMQFDINAQPIMEIALSGGDLATLQTYAEDVLKSGIERIEGVASVSIAGGYENYIQIKVDTEKLIGYGISIDTIQQTLSAENINLPAGTVNKGKKELLVRTVGEFKDIDEIENIHIVLRNGSVIRLSDVADITYASKTLKTISKVNGEPAVSLSVQKQSGKNTVLVANEVRQTIEEFNQLSDYKLDIVIDQSEYIERSIAQVASNAVVGGILAVLVLLIFLRNFRSTVIIALSIPISIIATFVLIYFNGITLNMMTLGGLALGIGMLVDNSVVVLENIYRYRQEGYSKFDSAVEGAKEVSMSVTASTLTTVAVFLPMVFVEGVSSIMFRELALTVTFSLFSSLVVSLTLIPMLSSKLLKIDEMQGTHHVTKYKLSGIVLDRTDVLYKKIENSYKSLLAWSLKHRKMVVIIAAIFFISSMLSVSLIGSEFFPSADEGQFSISIELENGAKAKDTSAVIDTVVENVKGIEEIDSLFSITQSGAMFDASQNTGSIKGVLIPLDERERTIFEVINDIEDNVKDIPGAKITVAAASSMAGMGGGGGSAISILLKGDDYAVLDGIAEDMVNQIRKVEGTKNVASNLSDVVPQVEIKLKQEKAASYGLTTFQVANTIKAIVNGRTATTYKVNGEELDVIIEGTDLYEESISNFEQILIQSPAGGAIPLELVADIKVTEGYTTLYRDSQIRTATITSDIEGRDLGSIVADIEQVIDDVEIPVGYTYEIGGQNKEMIEAFSDLFLALGIAVLLVYMILASQFESLLTPFIIMLSTPFAFSGGLIGLLITNRTLNMTSIIGFIMLSGIVVNNAIVLIDYINTRRGRGEAREEAILKAGPIRLRPILMTTLTTVLAMIPLGLGIGEGAEMQAPMATVIIFGLMISMLLTLVFIPVLYTLFDDKSQKRKDKRKKKEEQKSQKMLMNKQS